MLGILFPFQRLLLCGSRESAWLQRISSPQLLSIYLPAHCPRWRYCPKLYVLCSSWLASLAEQEPSNLLIVLLFELPTRWILGEQTVLSENLVSLLSEQLRMESMPCHTSALLLNCLFVAPHCSTELLSGSPHIPHPQKAKSISWSQMDATCSCL